MEEENLEKQLSKEIGEFISKSIIISLFVIGCYKYYYYGMEQSFIWFIIGLWVKVGNDNRKLKIEIKND